MSYDKDELLNNSDFGSSENEELDEESFNDPLEENGDDFRFDEEETETV
jgi:hypothetical protein